MSFETIRRAMKRAHKDGETYTVIFEDSDFFDLADFLDELEERRKAQIHRVSAKALLRILPVTV